MFCPFAWRDPAHPEEVYSQNKGEEDYDYLTADWFLDVVKNDSAKWSEPFYDGYDESTALSAYMVPIHDPSGRVVAVMGADISLDWFANKLSEADSIVNKNKMLIANRFNVKSNSFIINHDGTYITHTDDNRIMKDNFFRQVKTCDGSDKEELINRILKDEENDKTPERLFVDGKECYLFYMPVKYTKWVLMTVVPCKAVDMLCYLNGAAVILIVLLPLLLLIFIGYYYMRKALKSQDYPDNATVAATP